MQVAGKTCSRCKEKIFIQLEGSWCPQCNAPYHTACIDAGPCGKCDAALVASEKLRTYSSCCPACGKRFSEPRDNCPTCRSRTSWDDQEAYRANKSQVNQYGRHELAIGILEAAVAVAALILFFGILSGIVSLYAIPDGIWRITKGWRAARFK